MGGSGELLGRVLIVLCRVYVGLGLLALVTRL